jgi:hypothetical protein
MRHLNQDSGTVPCFSLTAASTPVVEVVENLDGLTYNGVRFSPFLIDDEANATRVMLKCGVIESLSRRPSSDQHLSIRFAWVSFDWG